MLDVAAYLRKQQIAGTIEADHDFQAGDTVKVFVAKSHEVPRLIRTPAKTHWKIESAWQPTHTYKQPQRQHRASSAFANQAPVHRQSHIQQAQHQPALGANPFVRNPAAAAANPFII